MSESNPTLNSNEAAHKLVTTENVAAALLNDKGSDAALKSFEIIDFTSKGDNYACFVTSVKVKFTMNGNEDDVTYVVKLNPCRGIVSMESFTANVFKKEANFYTEIVPLINSILKKYDEPQLRVPNCYYTSYEPRKEIIFLQDMRSMEFKMFNRMVGLDENHTNLVLEELARLHAASALLAMERKTDNLEKEFPFLRELFTNRDDEAAFAMFQQFFQTFIETGAIIADKMKYANVAKYLRELQPKIIDTMIEELDSTPPFLAICHGDCWNNNLLFRYDEDGKPTEVCLLDLQINRSSSLGNDLNYLLFSSLTGDVRKKNIESFLSRYHSTYSQVLKNASTEMTFTLDQLLKEYVKRNRFGLIMSMMVVPLVVMEATDVPDYQDISEENLDAKIEESKTQVLEMIDTSPLLRPRFLDMFDEMIENGVIKA